MTSYWLYRLAQLPVLLLGVTFVTFLFVFLMPGDPAFSILGDLATPEAVANINEALGLNRPWYLQYFGYLSRLLSGNFGTSILTGQSVAEEILARFPATAELSAVALLIAIAVGIPIGIISATRRGTIWDTLSTTVALLGVSVPSFWLGLMLIYFASAVLQILPPGGRIDLDVTFPTITGFYLIDSLLAGDMTAFISAAKHLALPSLVLSTVPMAIIARVTRTAMLEALQQDYMRTGRAKGMSEYQLIVHHALKNAMLPIVTVLGLQVGRLLTGAILTETIFSWPGVGYYVYSGVSSRDFPVVQSGILFFAVIFIVVNFIVDIAYSFIDPRIRYA